MRTHLLHRGMNEPLCTLSQANCALAHSNAQNAEDLMLLATLLLHAQRFGGAEGTRHFVELGAYDGVTFSNTYMLEKCFDWSGLLVEANPANFHKLNTSGRRSTLVHSAVCSEEHGGMVEFMVAGNNFAGAIDSLTDEKMSKMPPRIRAAAKARTVQVPCRPLKAIMADAGVHRAQLLSLDVEGAEEKVLQTVNPDAFELCLVEREDAEGVGSGRGQRIDARMQQAGLRETSGLHDHWNRIYVHQPAVEVVLNASWMRVAGPGRRAKLDAERWRGRELLRAIAEASCIAKQPVECVTHLSENAVYMSVHSRTVRKKDKGVEKLN